MVYALPRETKYSCQNIKMLSYRKKCLLKFRFFHIRLPAQVILFCALKLQRNNADATLLGIIEMLINTFCHIPGIGSKTEEKLWNFGI
jgi:hypothetical protein